MPSQQTLEAKQKLIQELVEKFKKSKLVILADYKTINVEEVTKMRADLREVNADYKVAKNILVKFAAKETNLEELEEHLKGQTAVIFSYDDYVQPAKIVHDFAESKEAYTIKAGVMDGKVVSVDEINKLAKLPSKELLQAQLATVLLANIRNLAVVLDQTKQSKEEDAE